MSNLVNFYLDAQINKAVSAQKGTYTRYADDIAISYPLDYPKSIHSIVDRVRRLLHSKGYRTHTLKKLRIRRQHQRQVVTGLVVNAKAQLPRETRRWLRAVEHRAAQGKEVTLTPEQLQGWLAYARSTKAVSGKQREYRLKDNRRIVKGRKNRHQKSLKPK